MLTNAKSPGKTDYGTPTALYQTLDLEFPRVDTERAPRYNGDVRIRCRND